MRLLKTLLSIIILFCFYVFLYYPISYYSCPHFLVFPSSKKIAQNVLEKPNYLEEREVPVFTDMELKNIQYHILCNQGSDDEAEIVKATFEYRQKSRADWNRGRLEVYTDYKPNFFSKRFLTNVKFYNSWQ